MPCYLTGNAVHKIIVVVCFFFFFAIICLPCKYLYKITVNRLFSMYIHDLLSLFFCFCHCNQHTQHTHNYTSFREPKFGVFIRWMKNKVRGWERTPNSRRLFFYLIKTTNNLKNARTVQKKSNTTHRAVTWKTSENEING